MSKEVLSKQTVLNIITQYYNFHKGAKNEYTANALAVVHNVLNAIEGIEMTDCADCEYFQKYKEIGNE